MKMNRPAKRGDSPLTHEGGLAKRITVEQELRRTVAACLLWEDTFYEEGKSIADRIAAGVKACKPESVAALAIEARVDFKLRHVPLLLCRELARNKKLKAHTLASVIQRADELTEFLAIYWKDGKTPLAGQVKKGLAAAFTKFSAYDLAKYNRDEAIKLRDVLFLSHARPLDKGQAIIWEQLIKGELVAPDTWEVALSAGKDKKETWLRLMAENKLGALALLRNLRNMELAGVPIENVREALAKMDVSRVLPFRFIAAAKYAPRLEPDLEKAMFRCIADLPKLEETIILVDTSASMNATLSGRSEMTRMDAACALAMMVREMGQNVRVYGFTTNLKEVPARRGFALRDALKHSQVPAYTYLGKALAQLPDTHRLIVVSDEQCQDDVTKVRANHAYMINVAVHQNGVGYGGKWTHIDGFSESTLRYIQEVEAVA